MFALIEMNLLPGGKRASSGPKKRRKSSKPRFEGLGQSFKGDPWVAGVALLAVAVIGYAGYSFLNQARQLGQLEDDIEVQVQDSARYAKIIAAAESLRARQDTVTQKISMIRSIDGDRFIWAHILDEVSRALPEYTSLTGLQQTSGDATNVTFRIEGLTGTTLALTRFMRDLEASPFLGPPRLASVEQMQQSNKVVNNFILEVEYTRPDSTVLNTEPIILAGE